MVNLLGRIWTNNETALGEAGQYVVWDKDLYKQMMYVEQKLIDGKANWFEKFNYNIAKKAHQILNSPMFESVRKVMGTMDQYFRVVAARQVATERAIEKAFDKLGDRPPTAKAAAEFGDFVVKQKELELLNLVDSDGVTVLKDPDAVDLGDTFTFQKTQGQLDRATEAFTKIASIPGAKIAGFTFVKTPSLLLKASLDLTPGLSTIIKNVDPKYRKGSPSYRAVKSGVEAMSYFILGWAGLEAMNGNLTGAGPVNPTENQAWQRAGNKPFTYKKGGVEINYQYLDPMATVVGVIADSVALGFTGNMASSGSVFEDLLSVLSSNVINKSYLAQISQLAEFVQLGDDGDPGRLLWNKWRGFQPFISFRTQTGEVIDPYVRETRSQMEPWWKFHLAKATGFGATMHSPHRLDPLTAKPLTRDGVEGWGGRGLGLLNLIRPFGVQFSKERHDFVHKKLYKHGIKLDTNVRELEGLGFDNAQISKFIEFQANVDGEIPLRKALTDYFTGPAYERDLKLDEQYPAEEVSDTFTHKSLKQIVNPYKEMARYLMKRGVEGDPASTDFAKRLKQKQEELLLKFQSRSKVINEQRLTLP